MNYPTVSKFFIGLLIVSYSALSMAVQSNTAPNVIGDIVSFESEALGEERKLQVYVPANYQTSDKDYPVLYVLDGQWNFMNAVAIQQTLKVPSNLPEMIIVGTVNQNPQRRRLFGEENKFKRYLLDEVLPYIDSNYRTSRERLLFGWEMSAFFATNVFFNHSQLFDGAIITNGGDSSDTEIQKFNDANKEQTKYLFIANSDKDIYTVKYGKNLSRKLKQYANKQLNWRYQKFNEEVHASVPYVTMYQGLKHYYFNYQSLVFSDLEAFNSLGGLDYLTRYFKVRGQRFNLPQTIPDSTKNSLIWLAWNNNDFKHFTLFMKVFDSVLSSKRNTSMMWQNRFARFYLKHGDLVNAQRYFEQAIHKYPNKAKLHEGLSLVFKAYGKREEARRHLIQAIELAVKTNDKKLASYQAALSKLY